MVLEVTDKTRSPRDTSLGTQRQLPHLCSVEKKPVRRRGCGVTNVCPARSTACLTIFCGVSGFTFTTCHVSLCQEHYTPSPVNPGLLTHEASLQWCLIAYDGRKAQVTLQLAKKSCSARRAAATSEPKKFGMR